MLRIKEPVHQPTIPPIPEPIETKETTVSKEQRFIKDVINLANERNLNCFVVTDKASGITNIESEAVNNVRKAYIQLELEHGLDPDEEWNDTNIIELFEPEKTEYINGMKNYLDELKENNENNMKKK